MIEHTRPSVLGTEVNPGTRQDVLTRIASHLAEGHGLLHVVTANPEYVITARQDSVFRDAINSAGLVTVDGAGLAVAMRLLYPRLIVERFTGVMLTPEMASLSANTGAGLFLLGAGPGIAAAAAAELRAKYPAANIVGAWGDATPGPVDDAETLQRIIDSGAQILLVAYGAPAQIYWIQRNFIALQAAGVRVVSGVGGAFDYISGHTPWAPSLVRKFGMEWLYRLVREPHRWRRQLALPRFAFLVLLEYARARVRGGVE